MDARHLRALVALGALVSCGASARTQHFLVTAPTDQLARQVARAAEQYRHDLAMEWLGKPLAPWADICPIQVVPNRLASGETSFVFPAGGGHPRQWRMIVEGTPERILDSVLPHEILHTVFATHYQQPLPRWADEGACTTVEHQAERGKHEKLLRDFLTSEQGIPFNKMFQMREYPANILPLYSQGYSLARYLIAQGGKQKFVKYVGEGMRTNNWTAATRKYYRYDSLSDLQLRWVGWVAEGSPAIRPREPEAVASVSPPSNAGRFQNTSAPVPQRRVAAAPTDDDGWYARTARAAQQRVKSPSPAPTAAVAPPAEPERTSISRARHFEPAGQTILQWSQAPSSTLRR